MTTEKFNKEKFKTMIHYIISKCENNLEIGRTVLYKLLYFSDFNNFEIYEKSISNETYKKYPKGPIPTHYEESKEELIKENKIKEETKKIFGKTKYICHSLENPNLNSLSTYEIDVINDVIDKLASMTAKEISEYSHGDMPWMATEEYEDIEYGFVFYRDPEYCVRTYEE